MPAGRLQVGFDDIRYDAITLWADASTITFDVTKVNGSAAVGLAVTYTGTADTVALCADGDAIVGKLIKVEPDGACTVQNKGMAFLPAGNAATNTAGVKQIGALGASSAKGYVRNTNSATAAELPRTGPFAVDVATATAIVVDFG